MTYRTLKQYDKAIQAYKNTIEKYAGSEEAYAALEGLEQVYVETNNINDYFRINRFYNHASTTCNYGLGTKNSTTI